MQPTSSPDDESPSSLSFNEPTLDSNIPDPSSHPDHAETASHQTSASSSQEIAGRYKLLSVIGEGGMGSVWLAEQRVPVKRLVALKLIKSGMDSKAVVARFDAERQALAMMDHPNIARILDGGITETGSPYFVMELVKGVPITEYCDSKKLNIKERLELFIAVCQAIQHAHQKGIIHRDIKPSNVLVATYDDKAVPKVIDFGVAKATGAALTDITIQTGFGIVGTPQYMSPEQATLNQLDIDTRSDIYSLGVLLYELLTGAPPFGVEELQKAGYIEMLRVIREDEPPRPSTKLSTADTLPKIANTRSTEPAKLTGQLRTELDWVVMKAIEKERTRRYETANAFANDIQRCLSGKPVEAHPPSRAYQFHKFVRRYRTSISVASALVLTLLAGIIATSYALWEANHQKEIAILERANAQKSEEEALEAYRSATDDAISDLMSAKEYLGPQEKVYLQKAIDRWNKFASRQGDDERSLAFRAEGLFRVGSILAYLSGSPDETLAQAESLARELCRRFPNTDRYEKLLSAILQKQNNHTYSLETQLSKLSESQKLLERIVARTPGDSIARFDLAKVHSMISDAYLWNNENQNAFRELETSINQLQNLVVDEPTNKLFLYDLSNSVGKLSELFKDIGQLDQAIEKGNEAFSLSTRLLQLAPEERKSMALQAMNFQCVGNAAHSKMPNDPFAGRCLQSAIRIAKDLCEKFPNDVEALNLLAQFYNDLSEIYRSNDVETALTHAREAVAIQERLNQRHPGTGSGAMTVMRLNLITVLYAAKEYRECIDLAMVHADYLRSLVVRFDADSFFQEKIPVTLSFKAKAQESLQLMDDALSTYREAYESSLLVTSTTPNQNMLDQLVTDRLGDLVGFLIRLNHTKDVQDVYESHIKFLQNNNLLSASYFIMQNYADYLVRTDNPQNGIDLAEQAIIGFQSLPGDSTLSRSLETAVRKCRLIKAKGLCLLGKQELANQEWESLLHSTDPKIQLSIRVHRSQVRFDAGLHREALEEINELVRSSSLPAQTSLQFARIYAKHAEESPESSELSTKRSLALLDKGADAGLADPSAIEQDVNFAELRDRQEFQVILNKVKSNALISSASKKLQLKDFSGCIADLDKALDLNPRNNLAFSDRGWAKHNLNDFAGALADYDRAIDADPKQDIAIVNKAFLLATVPDPSIRDGANTLELADRGWQIKQSPYCLNAKSCALAAMGRFDEAIEVQTRVQSDTRWLNDDGIDGGQYSEARIESWKAKKLWHPPYQEQNEK